MNTLFRKAHVAGYTRRDGTRVRPYETRAPSARPMARMEFADDMQAQAQWLLAQAQAAGYRDMDALLEADFDGFMRLAEQWRARQTMPEAPPVVRRPAYWPLGSAVSAEHVWRILERDFGVEGIGRLQNAGTLRVAQTAADLPPGLTETGQRSAGGIYDPASRVAWIIADQTSAEQVPRVFLHEIGEHHGLQVLIGAKGWRALCERVREMPSQSRHAARVWQGVREAHPEFAGRDFDDLGRDERFLHEVIASMGEVAELRALPWWRELLAALRIGLLRLGFAGRLNESDIGSLLIGAARRAMRDAPMHKAQPTPAQAEAGNYKKRHIRFQGLEIAIENPKGSVRRGVDAGGKAWSTRMQADYGYINRSMGTDGDQVDVFIGPDKEAGTVYVVTTLKPPQFERADENKCMLGYTSEAAARRAFLAHYDDRRFLGGIKSMPMDAFKTKVLATKDRPKLIKGIDMNAIERLLGDFGRGNRPVLFLKGYVRAHDRHVAGQVVPVKAHYTAVIAQPKAPAKGRRTGRDTYTGDLFGGQDMHVMPKKEAIAEHERLVDVLNSPIHADDKDEAKRQAKELEGMKADDSLSGTDDPGQATRGGTAEAELRRWEDKNLKWPNHANQVAAKRAARGQRPAVVNPGRGDTWGGYPTPEAYAQAMERRAKEDSGWENRTRAAYERILGQPSPSRDGRGGQSGMRKSDSASSYGGTKTVVRILFF